MNPQFNKHAFVDRLMFFFRLNHSVCGSVNRKYGDQMLNEMHQFLWDACVTSLWEQRFFNMMEIGMTKNDQFETFSSLVTLGFNMLKPKIEAVRSRTDICDQHKLVEIMIIANKSFIELADDVETIFLTPNPIHNG